jgi:four helix bundle protein
MGDDVIPFDEWVADPRNAVTGDPVWRLPAYQLAIYCASVGWPDVVRLAKVPLTGEVGAQLYDALGSIGANLTEGYSRSSGRDRVRFYEYALGSARECVVWYRLGRPVLGDNITRHREETLQRIVRMLLIVIPRERSRNIGREE